MSRLLRVLAALSCLALVSALGLVAASPASASAYLLCRGYDACAAAGMPHAGYKAARGNMYWQMYAGHNCTNYAAYRMVRRGMPNIRPWDGPGNATYWGAYKPGITDGTPRVGAVAWWRSNVPFAGSAGHVAYVERVLSPDTIVVSEDNWGGDFQWRQITRDGRGGWPSGFIHFNDVRLRATVLPRVSGTPKVNEVLTASTGTWGPAKATERAVYRYQWRANGVNIADATGPTFTVGLRQEGRQISVRVRASSLGYLPGAAVSAATVPVEATTLRNLTPPRISGDPAVDQVLTASSGEWTAAPTTLTHQWLADGVPVDGATGPTFTPGPDLVGKALAVSATAKRVGYTDASADSAATAPVAPGTFARASAPVVSGLPRLGETLTVDAGAFSPAAEVSIRWLRAGVPVEGAAGPTYQLTAADLGSRMAARVRLSKPGYTSLRTKTVPTRRVRTVPVMQVRTEPGTGRLGVTANLTAEGVRPVAGKVRIRSGGRRLAELTLNRGTAATTLRGLPGGLRTFRIRYLGSRTVTAVLVVRTVRIR